MKTVQGDGVQLAYEERGKGPAVVLIAGGFLDMEQWDAQIAALSASYRVIRFDHRGVGESDKPVASYSIGQLALDTTKLIDSLDAAPCTLIGSSLGGLIAIEVALRRPETVQALILAASSAGARGVPTPRATHEQMFRGVGQSVEKGMQVLQETLFASDYPQRNPEWSKRKIAKRRANPVPMAGSLGPLQSALQYDPLEQLPSLSIPTLVLHGAKDRLTPVENAFLLARQIPKAEITVVPEAGHAVVIESAAAVNRAFEGFLAQLGDKSVR